MNKQKVTTVYIWVEKSGNDVNIARNGFYGYSEHLYKNVSDSSITRLLYATPIKPSYIKGKFIRYEI